MKRGRKAKSNFDKLKELDPMFLESVDGLSDTESLKTKIIDLTKYQIELLVAKKDDIDLQRIAEQKKVAEETYSIPLKGNKLKIGYLVELLQSKGK